MPAETVIQIEFTGPTGAGKSTMLGKVLECLTARGVSFASNHEAFFSFAPVRHPTLQNLVLDARALRSLAKRGMLIQETAFAWRMTSGETFLPYRMNAIRSYVRKRGMAEYCLENYAGQRVFMDEGLVHGMHNLLISANRPPDAAQVDVYLRHIPLPDRVVLTTVPVETLKDRILSRPNPPLRSRDRQALMRFCEYARLLFEIAAAHPRLKNKLLIVDDMGYSIEELANQLIATPDA